jgi:GNAT superfamily N-acetyltransferase
MRCRPATPADVPAIARLRHAWTEEDAGHAIADEGFDAAFATWWEHECRHRRHWVAEIDTDDSAGIDIVGMASIVVMSRMPQPGRPPTAWGYVHHVYVRPEHRSGGVGAALMGALADAGRADGYERLVLHPRPRSAPFYERLGFRPVDDLVALVL